MYLFYRIFYFALKKLRQIKLNWQKKVKTFEHKFLMQMSLTGKANLFFCSDPVMYKIMNQCCEIPGVENYKYQKY